VGRNGDKLEIVKDREMMREETIGWESQGGQIADESSRGKSWVRGDWRM
jgi:hypothetical protein